MGPQLMLLITRAAQHSAALQGRTAVVQLLLCERAAVNIVDLEGRTAKYAAT